MKDLIFKKRAVGPTDSYGVTATPNPSAHPAVDAGNRVFSNNVTRTSTRIKTHSLIGSKVSFLSVDEKDIYVNPWNLKQQLDSFVTPCLNSISPMMVNFAADGFPRLDGIPWNGGSPSELGGESDSYDPSDPSTLISFGLVVDPVQGDIPYPVLGFRIRARIFDTELGTSTLGIRVFSQSYEDQVLNALISVDANDAEIVIPYFEANVVRSTVGANSLLKSATETMKFETTAEVRDGSYNLVIAPSWSPASGSKTASIAELPSFFTLTGQNVYAYVSPIMATDANVTALLSTLSSQPGAYLQALKDKTC